MGSISQADCAVYKLDANLSSTSLRKYTRLRTEAWQAVYHHDLLHAPMALKTCSFRQKELAAPHFHCWVCVVPNAQNGSLDLEHGQWAGICIAQGPYSEADYNKLNEPTLGQQGDRLELRWRLGGLYFAAARRDMKLYSELERTANLWVERNAKQECKAAGRKEILARQRFYAEIGSDAYESYLAGGCRLVKAVTLTEKLEDDGWMELVARELLTEADSHDRKSAIFEICDEFHV